MDLTGSELFPRQETLVDLVRTQFPVPNADLTLLYNGFLGAKDKKINRYDVARLNNDVLETLGRAPGGTDWIHAATPIATRGNGVTVNETFYASHDLDVF